MIFTAIENFVFFSTFLAVIAYGAAAFIRYGIKRSWWRLSPFALSRIFAGLIMLPAVVASWLVLAALLPERWLGAQDFRSAHDVPVHQLHLLSEVTASFEPLLAYATVLFLASVAFFIAWTSIRGYFRLSNVIRFLEIEAAAPEPEKIRLVEETAKQHSLRVGLVMSEQPFTFVWGFIQSKLIISSGLLHVLTRDELRGVIEHEAAHHVRRDNLVKFFLSAASYLSLVFPLTRRLLHWQAEQIELVCDEVAAASTGDPVEIASALVKVRRRLSTLSAAPCLTSGFVSDEDSSVELRVKRLLLLDDVLPSSTEHARLARKPLNEVMTGVTLFAGSLIAIMLFAPLQVHQAAETIIAIFK